MSPNDRAVSDAPTAATDPPDAPTAATDPPDAPTAATDPPDPAGERRTVAEIRSAYAGYADRIARFDWVDRLLVGRYRRRQFGDVSGRVLDVACGTGTNFPYLPSTVELAAVDVSPAMLAHARDRLDRLDIDGRLHEADAADLAFPDDSFDVVVSALSTCTFPEPVATLREMARVCRPGGEIRLLEHGRSDVEAVGRYQDWRAESRFERTGCRGNQDPLALVRASGSGLRVTDVRTALLGVVTAITAEPAPARSTEGRS
jgi:ubiquinone/menaquinone biosynthesis C-methylase UbiE